jgi:hypothetical protein|tara:strand:- start:391 stop:549 length:159 start_codon:yes stop_codon:yes gene_type:complete
VNKNNLLKQIEALKETIKWFRTQIEPHDCGWMYTTIDGLKHRIKFLRKESKR